MCSCAVLQGPLQSLTYLLNQGLLAATLGAFWSMHVHWAISVSTGAMVRVGGMMTYVLVSSWIMNENLFTIALTQVYALLVGDLSVSKRKLPHLAGMLRPSTDSAQHYLR